MAGIQQQPSPSKCYGTSRSKETERTFTQLRTNNFAINVLPHPQVEDGTPRSCNRSNHPYESIIINRGYSKTTRLS